MVEVIRETWKPDFDHKCNENANNNKIVVLAVGLPKSRSAYTIKRQINITYVYTNKDI